MKDCRDCKDYKDCRGKEWYHYGEIRFCPYQVMFIIVNSELLVIGEWPKRPQGAYTDFLPLDISTEAYYTRPTSILAEVEIRLGRINRYCKLALIDEVNNGLTFDTLSRPAIDALMYAKGWRRKRSSFSHWLSSKNNVQNDTKVLS